MKYDIKKIKIFESVRFETLEKDINEMLSLDVDNETFEVDIKVITYKDEENLDVVLYIGIVKQLEGKNEC